MDKTQFDPQNPNALFSPDQWSNQFSNFNNAPLPWPSSYVGMPTDAMGQPIQPPPGMTLNSTPQAQQPAAPASQTYGLQPSQLAGPSALNPSGNLAFGMSEWGGMMSPQARDLYRNQQFASPGQAQGSTPMSNQAFQGGAGSGGASGTAAGGGGGGMTMQQMMASFTPLQQQWWAGAPANEKQQAMNNYGVGRAPAAPAPAAPSGPTYPQILAMLANPGKVTTPGATVPIGPSAQPGAGANNAFLQQAQGRPGMNQNFLSALAAIQGR